MSYTNSPKQSSSSHGSASEQYIKIVEQLIDSDQDEQLLKKLTQLQPQFPILKKITCTMTNQQKINIFLRDHVFRMRLTDKLRQSNILFHEPIVKVNIYTIRHRCQVNEEFQQNDLQNVFGKFGNMQTLFFNKNLAYFRYDSYISCYASIKILNEFQISDTLRLSVKWCDTNDINFIAQHYAAITHNSSPVLIPPIKEKKCMARYNIYLQTTQDFDISRKVIGHKGGNMKKILNSVLQKYNIPNQDSNNSIAKLRLRGKGSGFKQGWNHAQSDQLLNLCVSSKNNQIFIDLCQQCQNLLMKIGYDYKDHYFKLHHKQPEGIIYRKHIKEKNGEKLVKQLNLEELGNAIDFVESPPAKNKIPQKQILRLIAIRDKARRQGRFSEADQIRQFLIQRQVLLIDEKHVSGKNIKTTWRYY